MCIMRFAVENGLLVPESSVAGTRQTYMALGRLPDWRENPLDETFSYSLSLQQYLYGKRLLLDELPFSFSLLYNHYLHGYVSFQKSFMFKKGRPICVRCGNHDVRHFARFPCARCREMCFYCRRCLMMGRSSLCTPLLFWTGPAPARKTIAEIQPPRLSFHLTAEQQRASADVRRSIERREERLVWAVCGAGKTEVLFEGIARAFASGWKVAYASPRTDVILEVAPRLQSAFPHVTVASFYGGHRDDDARAPIVAATTHQLLRFYRLFDVVIVDEVDAFPYDEEPMLANAVRNARKDAASVIYVTATPSERMKESFLRGRLPGVVISRRYHGHPLPLPRFCWTGNWKKKIRKGAVPTVVLRWLQDTVRRERQAFLFVPSIPVLKTVVPLLEKAGFSACGVHSADKKRKEKVSRFRQGDLAILVTTTILERGVTVPSVDVAVLGAEEHIFNERALVQIAGRAGRSAEDPVGDVVFFHHGKTKAMVASRRHILTMNRKGRMV